MALSRIEFQAGGLHLPELGLWLDPHEPQAGPEKVFVSHAHSDHLAPHREVILSAPTAKLMQARIPGERRELVLHFDQRQALDHQGNSFYLTLLPAGHIFGSAMSLLETDGTSLLYTGDFKLRPSRSAEPCEPRHADLLIMETTFGRPQYVFPPTEAVLEGITRFCREALDNDETPVLLGYSLGKSQELLCGLGQAGLPLMLHGTIYRLTQIYEQFGQCFPPYQRYDPDTASGKVLLCPPYVVNSPMLRKLGKSRSAILTGWAVDPGCRYRYHSDAAFPLSDHADFPDLLEMVKRVQPKKIYTLHGFAADFAQTLRELGYDAQALSQDEQFTLALDAPRPKPQVQAAKCVAPSIGENQASPEPAEHAGPESFARFAFTCCRIAAEHRKLEKLRLLSEYLRALAPPSSLPDRLDEPPQRFSCSGAEGRGEQPPRSLNSQPSTLNSSGRGAIQASPQPPVALAATWFSGRPFPASQNKVLQLGWALLRDALCAVAQVPELTFHQVYLKYSDLGETAFELLQHRNVSPSLTLNQLNDLFHQLQAARGPRAKLRLLNAALEQCTALEAKYLVKIITGDLRIGLKEGLVEEAVAGAFASSGPAIRQANLLTGDIGETARLAAEGRLTEATLLPFRPIKFMLASPEPTAEDIWQRVQDWLPEPLRPEPNAVPPAAQLPAAWLEDKYDGIRCQLHKVGPRVALYSRDLKEITPTFLELADSLRSLPADFILDGEIVAMRGEQVLPFAELQKRLGRRQGDLFMREEVPIQLVAFDLLWSSGQSLLALPLNQRRTRLEALAPFPAALRLAFTTQARSVAEINQAFAAARARGNEGLMIKDPASPYLPGRRGLSWLKLKLAFATLDCVVVGAEFGHGKRSQLLSDYTFAVRDEQTGQLETIGKAYTGLTDAEIAALTERFLKTARRQHGRYFELPPEVVLEIAFDRLQKSQRHSSGLAMRFPRILRIRTDKSVHEIDTLATARTLAR